MQRCDVMNCIHFSFIAPIGHWRFALQTEISGKYNSPLHFCFLSLFFLSLLVTRPAVSLSLKFEAKNARGLGREVSVKERLRFSFPHACSTRDLFLFCMPGSYALGNFPLIFFKHPYYLRARHTLHSIIHCSTHVNQEVQNLLNAGCFTWYWLAGNAACSYSQSFSAGSCKVHIVQTKALIIIVIIIIIIIIIILITI